MNDSEKSSITPEDVRAGLEALADKALNGELDPRILPINLSEDVLEVMTEKVIEIEAPQKLKIRVTEEYREENGR